MKKIGMIRKNDVDPCPFGLKIPFGCKNAGDIIEQLAPLDIINGESTYKDKDKIKRANKRLFRLRLINNKEEPKKCKYASKIFDEQDGVECNYEDTAPGVGTSSLRASPFYSQIFSGVALDGLYSYPIGFYADYNLSRNLFYGIYSLQGSKEIEELKKFAEEEKSRGAGFLFYCPDDNTVFLFKRSGRVTNPHQWGCLGGGSEPGEQFIETAFREANEEGGFLPKGLKIFDVCETVTDKSHSVTFLCEVPADVKNMWRPRINWESDKASWFNINDLPEQIHNPVENSLKHLISSLKDKNSNKKE